MLYYKFNGKNNPFNSILAKFWSIKKGFGASGGSSQTLGKYSATLTRVLPSQKIEEQPAARACGQEGAEPAEEEAGISEVR